MNVAIWSIEPKIDMNVLVLGERTLKGEFYLAHVVRV